MNEAPDPKPLVYVAGPYSSNPVHNTTHACLVAEGIERDGAAVVIPHLSLLWDLVSPADVERWYERDLHVLSRCDAVARFDGDSVGADREWAFALSLDKPCFRWPDDRALLNEWIYKWRKEHA